MFDAPKVKLGRMPIATDEAVTTFDLKRMRQFFGRDIICGVLGMDYLKKFIVRIDFDRGQVLFAQSPGKDPGVPVSLTFIEDDDTPKVSVRLAGWELPELFTVDTAWVGSNCGGLRPSILENLEKQKTARRLREGKAEVLDSSSIMADYQVRAFRLDAFEHKNLTFLAFRRT